MDFRLDFARAWLEDSHLAGRIKSTPADFIVEEIMDENFSGEGEHLYLKIRKTGQNTHWVAEQLARIVGVHSRDVGYAGRKDRLAITTQWFSVPSPREISDISTIEGCELLDVKRHSRKLRPGDHTANLFRIRVTQLEGDIELRSAILEKIAAQGFPNYFGTQRFGREAANLQRGWEAVGRRRRLKGRQAGMYLSALRSWIFNTVLDRHIQAGNWQTICGSEEPWSGPLWGRGLSKPAPGEEQIESEVTREIAQLCDFLEHSGLNQERRLLAARPANFSVVDHSSELLEIQFELFKGQFATELLAEIGVRESI